MPTAGMAIDWKTEPVEPTEWRQVEECPGAESVAEFHGDARPARAARTYPGLKTETDRARHGVKSVDDLDGGDTDGYSMSTLDRAVAFLTTYLEEIWEKYGIRIPVPRMGPGPDGSIDIHWKQPTWELLVNIPADDSAMAVFYGDNYGAQKIKGSLDPRNFNLGIAAWLMN